MIMSFFDGVAFCDVVDTARYDLHRAVNWVYSVFVYALYLRCAVSCTHRECSQNSKLFEGCLSTLHARIHPCAREV